MVVPLKHSLAVVTDGWTITLFGHRFSHYRATNNQLMLSGSFFTAASLQVFQRVGLSSLAINGLSIVDVFRTGWQRLYDIAIRRSQFILRPGLLIASI
jgi:hypothetical protein